MAYRFHDYGFAYYGTPVPFRHARTCGDQRWSGSHVACVLHADHAEDDIPHESAEGDTWAVADPDAEERVELRLLAALLPLGNRPVPL